MSVAEGNRKYFNALGGAYEDIPWFGKIQEQIRDAIHSRLDWLAIPLVNHSPQPPKEVRLLDYACGTGLMARCLNPYVTFTQGIDLSITMVENFNKRVQEVGQPIETMSAVLGDLFTDPVDPEFSKPEYFNFDIVSVGLAFHHFENPIECARRLKERMRPGGVLVISEFLEGGDIPIDDEDVETYSKVEPGSAEMEHHHQHHHQHAGDHGHIKTIPFDPLLPLQEEVKSAIVVHSFSVQGITKIFAEAGLVDIDVSILEDKVWTSFAGKKVWKTIFLAKAKRPELETKSEL